MITENFIAVVDGVTSKTDYFHLGKTTGRVAMEIVKKQIEELPPTAKLEEFVQNVNKGFASLYREVDFPYEKKKNGFQAVSVIYSNFYREIWLIGDCQLVIDGKSYTNPKKSDSILAEMRSLILKINELKGNEISGHRDEGRELILPWIVESAIFANCDIPEFGYAVLNGEDIPESLLKVFPLDEGYHEIILASDGYPRLEDTLEKTEDRLKEQIDTDPMCYKDFHSTKGIIGNSKSFDDRTYIRFVI